MTHQTHTPTAAAPTKSLTKPSNNQPQIQPADLWELLTPPQRQNLRHTLVNICLELAARPDHTQTNSEESTKTHE
jgi:hypothetical protein